MEFCSAEARHAFSVDFRAAQEARRDCVTPKRSKEKDSHWRIWQKFCHQIDSDPLLQGITDKLPFLTVFAVRLREGTITPSGNSITARSVEDYLVTVGEEIASLGAGNPRLDPAGKLLPQLAQLQKAWRNADPPPTRVKPVPIELVQHAVNVLTAANTELSLATRDMLIIGYFYLLRPGEHTKNSEYNHPFRLMDTSFQVSPSSATVNGAIATQATLESATRVYLNFTDQKNGDKNEAITHGDTGDKILSPVQAVRRRVEYLRRNSAPPETPLFSVFAPRRTSVTAQHITNALKSSCNCIGPNLGIAAKDISARALRAGGAMALLRAQVDPTIVRMLGRWKSWTMIRYLHRNALNTDNLASKMLQGGSFVIFPATSSSQQISVLCSAQYQYRNGRPSHRSYSILRHSSALLLAD